MGVISASRAIHRGRIHLNSPEATYRIKSGHRVSTHTKGAERPHLLEEWRI
jgi:hypothetical protein